MSMQAVWLDQSSEKNEPMLRGPDVKRVGIGHALVDDFSFEQASSAIINHARSGGRPAYVITPNAQHIVLLEEHSEFRNIYNNADLVIADGVSLLFASRLYGRLLQERVAGVDLFVRLCGLAAKHNLKVFLLGGRPGSAELAASVLRSSFPSLQCETYCPQYGFESEPSELAAVADAVRAYQPHMLFVGLGAPKQEHWIYHHGLRLSVPVSLGIGGSFEMVGGVVTRAPEWVQKISCEWLYRLCAEPRRMWRRYLIGNFVFAKIVVKQKARRAFLSALLGFTANVQFGAELAEFTEAEQTGIVNLFASLFKKRSPEKQKSFAA